MAAGLVVPFCFNLIDLDFEFALNPYWTEEDLESLYSSGCGYE
jgi:hypothetical protein